MEFYNNINSEFKNKLDNVKTEKRLGIQSFHRYYGKLIPAIPRAAIDEFSQVGDLVFDPFTGSGTTAVEAIYADRNFLGTEINPLSVMISEIKTANYDYNTLLDIEKNILCLIDNDDNVVADDEKPYCINRDHWFKDFVQRDLIIIKRNIPKAVSIVNCTERDKYEKFLYGVLSAIVKQVSNADTHLLKMMLIHYLNIV